MTQTLERTSRSPSDKNVDTTNRDKVSVWLECLLNPGRIERLVAEKAARKQELKERVDRILAELKLRSETLTHEEVAALGRIFEDASRAARERRIFGDRPRTTANANRYTASMAERHDLTDQDRKEFADDLRYLRETYGWKLECKHPTKRENVECTVSVNEGATKQSKRFLVREAGGKRTVIARTQAAPIFQFG